MDVTRVPALPPATEGGPDAAEVVMEWRRRVQAFAHRIDDGTPLGYELGRLSVVLREVDRLAAENERLRAVIEKVKYVWASEHTDYLICSDCGSQEGEEHSEGCILAAALAPRPAAPAAPDPPPSKITGYITQGSTLYVYTDTELMRAQMGERGNWRSDLGQLGWLDRMAVDRPIPPAVPAAEGGGA